MSAYKLPAFWTAGLLTAFSCRFCSALAFLSAISASTWRRGLGRGNPSPGSPCGGAPKSARTSFPDVEGEDPFIINSLSAFVTNIRSGRCNVTCGQEKTPSTDRRRSRVGRSPEGGAFATDLRFYSLSAVEHNTAAAAPARRRWCKTLVLLSNRENECGVRSTA